jgi:hypothetical protein
VQASLRVQGLPDPEVDHMSVYDELCGFVLVHRACGEIQARVDPATEWRYSVQLTCGCGTELRRSVTQEDAHEDVLGSALLMFETRTPRATRRRSPRYGAAPAPHSVNRRRPPSATRPLGPGVRHVASPSPSSEMAIKLKSR